MNTKSQDLILATHTTVFFQLNRLDLFTGGLEVSQRDFRFQNIKAFEDFHYLITRSYSSKIFRQESVNGACNPQGITVEPEFVGLGWILHFGRLWDYNGANPILELPDGSRHMFYDDSFQPGRKISKSGWILNAGVDGSTTYHEATSPGPDIVKMRFHVSSSYMDFRGGRSVLHPDTWYTYTKPELYATQDVRTTFLYARDSGGHLWPKEVLTLCGGRAVFNWDQNSAIPVLNSIDFKWLDGSFVTYTYQYITIDGIRLLRLFRTPMGRTYQYDYDPSTKELTKITISTGPDIDASDLSIEYTYNSHQFKISPFFLDSACSRVVEQKKSQEL